MATDNMKKAKIQSLKKEIAHDVFRAAKIQVLSDVEDEIIRHALEYALTDQCGKYDDRIEALNTHIFLIRGVLFSHTNSPQINLGTPANIHPDIPNTSIYNSIDDVEEFSF